MGEVFQGDLTSRHPVGEEAEADLLARWLTNGARLVEDADLDDVTLVTGADYAGLRDRPEATTSTSSTTLPRVTTTTRAGQTSTTELGTIPKQIPEGVDCG